MRIVCRTDTLSVCFVATSVDHVSTNVSRPCQVNTGGVRSIFFRSLSSSVVRTTWTRNCLDLFDPNTFRPVVCRDRLHIGLFVHSIDLDFRLWIPVTRIV